MVAGFADLSGCTIDRSLVATTLPQWEDNH